jgi:hypothetical protein
MEVDEIHEMQEHAEHSAHNPSMVPVTFTMAVLAVVLAATTLLGHRSHTEELLMESKATDQWAYFQAKNIRIHNIEVFIDLLSITPAKDPAQVGGLKEKYTKNIERYRDELKEIETEAHDFEAESAAARRRGNRFDLGEVCLDAAIVIVSLTLLTKKRGFWIFGLLMGLAGVGIALSGFAVH